MSDHLAKAAMPDRGDGDWLDEPWLGPPHRSVPVRATVGEADDVPMFPDLTADGDWLDELLDSVHPGQGISVGTEWGRKHGVPYGASIYFQYSVDPKDGVPLMANVTGVGPTRRAAIENAVAKAKEVQGGIGSH